MQQIISDLSSFIWGPVMLAFLVGTGVFLLARFKFLPIRNFWYAVKQAFKKSESKDGDISSFEALMTSLAATVGTGNIIGVATAMSTGGAGALLWMNIAAIIGLSVKYAEGVLGVKYREKNKGGEMCGGPMYAIKNGFKVKWAAAPLAVLFSLFTLLASFGVGNTVQINAVSVSAEEAFSISPSISGAILAILVGIVILGGIKSIGKVSSVLVPFMAIAYILGALIIIFARLQFLPGGITQIVKGAFSLKAVSGGTTGFIAARAMRYGVSRGVFTNEAGMGSAGISAAAARVDYPSKQGYITMTSSFFDTILMCTLTGLCIAVTGVLNTGASDAQLSILAFKAVFGQAGQYCITISLALFAFTSVVGWYYNGEKSLGFLTNSKTVVFIYKAAFVIAAYLGAVIPLRAVWSFADLANGLMMIPNLICVIALNNVVAKETFAYERRIVKKLERRLKRS